MTFHGGLQRLLCALLQDAHNLEMDPRMTTEGIEGAKQGKS